MAIKEKSKISITMTDEQIKTLNKVFKQMKKNLVENNEEFDTNIKSFKDLIIPTLTSSTTPDKVLLKNAKMLLDLISSSIQEMHVYGGCLGDYYSYYFPQYNFNDDKDANHKDDSIYLSFSIFYGLNRPCVSIKVITLRIGDFGEDIKECRNLLDVLEEDCSEL